MRGPFLDNFLCQESVLPPFANTSRGCRINDGKYLLVEPIKLRQLMRSVKEFLFQGEAHILYTLEASLDLVCTILACLARVTTPRRQSIKKRCACHSTYPGVPMRIAFSFPRMVCLIVSPSVKSIKTVISRLNGATAVIWRTICGVILPLILMAASQHTTKEDIQCIGIWTKGGRNSSPLA